MSELPQSKLRELSAARRTLERLKVPKELLAKGDYGLTQAERNFGNQVSITAAFCGDPSFSRSALGGYRHPGESEQ